MAAQVLKRGQAVVWIPPRSVGERAFVSEQSLLVMLPEGSAGSLEAVSAGEQGPAGVRFVRTSLDALPPLRSVQLVFDARDVTLLRIKVPPLSGSRLRQAVPNLVEELLLQDPQQCGFAIGPSSAGGERVIAAVDRSWLNTVVGVFERRAMRVSAAWAGQLAIPRRDPVASLACVRDGLFLRTGSLEGMGWSAGESLADRTEAMVSLLQTAWPPDALRADSQAASEGGAAVPAAPTGHRARRLLVFIDSNGWQPAVMAAASRLNLLPEIRALPLPAAGPIDLLSARAGTRASRWLADLDWRNWRLPGALAVAACTVWLTGLNLHWISLEAEKKSLRQAIEQRYREAFPQAQVIVDPVLQMERQIAALRARAGEVGAEDFIPLVGRFAQALGAQGAGALSGIEYRDSRLRVRFQPGLFDGRPARDSIVQACQRLGLQLRFDADREPTATVTLLR